MPAAVAAGVEVANGVLEDPLGLVRRRRDDGAVTCGLDFYDFAGCNRDLLHAVLLYSFFLDENIITLLTVLCKYFLK